MASGLVSYVQLASTELALKSIAQQQRVVSEFSESHGSTTPDVTSEHLHEHEAPASPKAAMTELVEIDDGVTSTAFMQALKAWTAELSSVPTSAHQGNALAQAITAGTLHISDPLEGITVTAWDAAGERPDDIHHKTMPAIGWSQFLKQSVKRANTGYAKDADGNYVDLISGKNAYFAAIGNRFVYLTWPKIS